MQKLLKLFLPLLLVTLNLVPAQNSIQLNPLGKYETGIFADGGTEISAYDKNSKKLFVTNASNNTISIIDMSNPSNLALISSLNMEDYGAGANSVAFKNGILAVAMEAEVKQDNGKVVFFDSDGNYLSDVTAGALPDMVAFSPDGNYVLSANEGEPNDEYTVDPEGSVTIIDISGGVANVTQGDAVNATFTSFNNTFLPGVRVFGPGATLAQDIEPEYITFFSDGQTAFISCQENNALAVISLTSKTVVSIFPLGVKNHNLPQNAIDASDKDDVINIAAWPVMGLYLPDAIDSYNVNGIDYIVSANEGDSRDYDGYSEEERVKDVNLDPTLFPDAASLQENGNIGRLKMTSSMGNFDGDNDFDTIYTFGARSFSIWNGSTGDLVFDSGDDLEQITAAAYQNDFNSTNDENESFDSRSDDKGPEPEGIVVGEIDGDYYAFIGLERMGGVMVYKVSVPVSPEFIQYITTRDFSGDPAAGSAGNMGPEGIIFIPANESPNGKNLLVVTYEISGSVQVFEINEGTVPVELSSFVAGVDGNKVNLVWSTSSESNNEGFEIERSIDNKSYSKIAEISGNGTTSEMNFYSFTDKIVNSGKYYYRLKQIDFNGEFTYSETIEISINQPESFSLTQNYPNPFNPSTTITFSLPEKSNVSLQVYDLLGKEIATLMNEVKAAGNYTINFDASGLSSGVYYYRLVAGNFISVRKMNLIK